MKDPIALDESSWINDFVDCLNRSRLAQRTDEEAITIKNPHLPKRVYKYRFDNENSRIGLTDNTVWLASPDAYNDPYDCGFKVSEDEVVAELKLTALRQFATIYKLEEQEASQAIDAALNSGGDPLLFLANFIAEKHGEHPGTNPRKMGEFNTQRIPQLVRDNVKFLGQWRQTTKICSFSASNDSLLMWGHYTDNHRGFCIEYDIEGFVPEHTLRRNLYPVIYTPDLFNLTPFVRGLVSGNQDSFSPSTILLSVLHKFEGWSYEREWRAIFFTEGISPDRVSQVPTPSSVFLGSKMDEKHAEKIAAICAARNIQVWKMALVPDKFQLVANPYIPAK